MSGPFLKPAESKAWFEATTAEFADANPILPADSVGVASDSGLMKFGDGVSNYSDRPAANLLMADPAAAAGPALNGKRVVAYKALTNGSYEDVYTCPAGYKAHVVEHTVLQPTTTLSLPQVAIRRGGVDYQYARLLINTARWQTIIGTRFVLEAGEILRVAGAAADQKYWAAIVLVPDGSPVRTVYTAIDNTDTLLYEVPEGKVAYVSGESSPQIGTFVVVNTSAGGSRTITPYRVPAGQSVGATYAGATSTVSNASNQMTYFLTGRYLGPGEKIYVKSDNADAGQAAWITVAEVDAE